MAGKLIVVMCALLMISPIAYSSGKAASLEQGIEELAIDISSQMKAKGVRKIAIDDFTDLNGYQSALGDFISEELVTSFYTQAAGDFDVVERRELARVLKEHRLGSSGLLNKETIAKVGEILGIDAIVTGSIAYLGRDIKVNARMIGVNDARVFAASSKKMPKDEVVESLLGQSARMAQLPGQSVSGSSAIQVQSHEMRFQNQFLLVTPKAITVSKDKKMLSIALEFKNLMTKDLLLMVENTSNSDNGVRASIIGDDGTLIDSNNGSVYVTGLTSYNQHIGVVYNTSPDTSGNWGDKSRYSTIDPSSKTTVIFRFKMKTFERESIAGRIFSFSANILRYTGKYYRRFSIGIPNIRLSESTVDATGQ